MIIAEIHSLSQKQGAIVRSPSERRLTSGVGNEAKA